MLIKVYHTRFSVSLFQFQKAQKVDTGEGQDERVVITQNYVLKITFIQFYFFRMLLPYFILIALVRQVLSMFIEEEMDCQKD